MKINTKLGRFYAATPETGRALQPSQWALANSPTYILYLWELGHLLPSLTTTLKRGRGLVASNKAVTGRGVQVRSEWLKLAKELELEGKGKEGHSIPKPLNVGTAVHYLAELRAKNPAKDFEALKTQVEWEIGRTIPYGSQMAFEGYCEALEEYFNLHSEPHEAEVKVVLPKWAGTADAVCENSVTDFKTGKTLELRQSLVQAAALAEALNRDEFRVAWLQQTGEVSTFGAKRGSEMWGLAQEVFALQLEGTQTFLSEALENSKPDFYEKAEVVERLLNGERLDYQHLKFEGDFIYRRPGSTLRSAQDGNN